MLPPALPSRAAGKRKWGGSDPARWWCAAVCRGVPWQHRTGGCPGTSPPAPSCSCCCCCAEGARRCHPVQDSGSARRGHGGRPAPLAPTGSRLVPSPAASSELTAKRCHCLPEPPRRRGFCAPKTSSASRSQWLTLQAPACCRVCSFTACPDSLRAPNCPAPCTGQAPFLFPGSRQLGRGVQGRPSPYLLGLHVQLLPAALSSPGISQTACSCSCSCSCLCSCSLCSPAAPATSAGRVPVGLGWVFLHAQD